jgi:hypothetical protein
MHCILLHPIMSHQLVRPRQWLISCWLCLKLQSLHQQISPAPRLSRTEPPLTLIHVTSVESLVIGSTSVLRRKMVTVLEHPKAGRDLVEYGRLPHLSRVKLSRRKLGSISFNCVTSVSDGLPLTVLILILGVSRARILILQPLQTLHLTLLFGFLSPCLRENVRVWLLSVYHGISSSTLWSSPML